MPLHVVAVSALLLLAVETRVAHAVVASPPWMVRFGVTPFDIALFAEAAASPAVYRALDAPLANETAAGEFSSQRVSHASAQGRRVWHRLLRHVVSRQATAETSPHRVAAFSVFFLDATGHCVVAFRGAEDAARAADLLTDAALRRLPFTNWRDPAAHAGLLALYVAVRDDLHAAMDALSPSVATVTLTGHGTGGAIAQLAALDLGRGFVATHGTPDVAVFGAPRLGNAALRRIYEARTANTTAFVTTQAGCDGPATSCSDAMVDSPPTAAGYVDFADVPTVIQVPRLAPLHDLATYVGGLAEAFESSQAAAPSPPSPSPSQAGEL